MGRKKSKPEWQADALELVNALKGGGVVVHSTDTVWGLAANAKHAKAVSRIFEIKQRPTNSNLLMLVDSPGMVEQYLPNLPDSAWELMEVSDRPVTVIAPCSEKAKAELAPGLVAEGRNAGRAMGKRRICGIHYPWHWRAFGFHKCQSHWTTHPGILSTAREWN